MIKNIIILLVVAVVALWGLQNYTDFKAVDCVHSWLVKSNWGSVDKYKAMLANWILKLRTPDAEQHLNVFIRDGQFVPNSNPIKKGSKVRWINEDTRAHTVSGEGWGSGQIEPGKTYTKTFDTAGRYTYSCSNHPSEKGELIVE